MILYMTTGLPTLELEADFECNAYYVIMLCINYKLQEMRTYQRHSPASIVVDDDDDDEGPVSKGRNYTLTAC